VIVTSKDDAMRWLMFDFLKENGIQPVRSEDFQSIGRMGADGKLIGVIGYHGFSGLMCSMSCVGRGHWMSREFLFAMFDYPFRQLKMQHIFIQVADDNEKCLRLVRHMGYEEIMRVENGCKIGTDWIILRMTPQRCRWINKDRERMAA
jgi:RimJ/RimL family protein N-acetyltransferase